MNFEFEYSKLGIATSLSLILMLLKIGGTLNCAWWVTLLPLIILVGLYILVIWLIGFLIVMYFAFHGLDSDDTNSASGDSKWQERLKEALKEKNEESNS